MTAGSIQPITNTQRYVKPGLGSQAALIERFEQTGWMMWNYLVAALSCGSRIVLYDGSPLHPSPDHQFELVKQQG